MTTTTPTSTQPKRRWLRFSLRTLLVVSVLIGFGCAWVGVQLQQARRNEALVKEVQRLGGFAYVEKTGPSPVWKRRLFGAYAADNLGVDLIDTDATDSLLTQMKGVNCKYLSLHSTKVTDAGLAHLHGMTNLVHLDLTNTQITDAGLAHLQGLTSLYHLELNNTQITDTGLTHLEGMTSLEVLELDGTKVSQHGVDKLRKAIPHCQMSYSLMLIEQSDSNSP